MTVFLRRFLGVFLVPKDDHNVEMFEELRWWSLRSLEDVRHQERMPIREEGAQLKPLPQLQFMFQFMLQNRMHHVFMLPGLSSFKSVVFNFT